MAGNEDDSEYPGLASGAMHPDLEKFVSGFQTPEGKEWAEGAASRVQDYLTGRAIAKNAQDTDNALATNLHDAKTNLMGMVQDDPGATSMALDLVPGAVKALAEPHNVPDEHVGNLVSDMQGQIAHAAVSRLAEVDRPSAEAAMGKFGNYLPEGSTDDLNNYIMTQEALRHEDARAAGLQNLRDQAQASVTAGAGWLKSLTGDDGGVTFPSGWSAQMFADPSMNIPTKVALHAAYLSLQHYGDPAQSDPDVLHNVVSRIADGKPPPQGEIFAHMGRGLTLADAGLLASSVGNLSPDQSATMGQLSNTLDAARSRIAPDHYGPAGQVALQRFTKYLMTGMAAGGNITDLMGPDDVAFSRFQPTAADAAKTVTPDRPRVPLSQIFGRV